MHPHFGVSFVTPARELLWKVSSGPRSEKVARLYVSGYVYMINLDSADQINKPFIPQYDNMSIVGLL